MRSVPVLPGVRSSPGFPAAEAPSDQPSRFATSDLDDAALMQRLVDSNEQITEALIVSQDQVAALRALVGVPVGSLDDERSLELILHEGLELSDSDCAVLVLGRKSLLVGEPTAAAALEKRVRAGVTESASGARPRRFGTGSAVIGSCGPEQQERFGIARCTGTLYSTGDVQLIDAVVATVDKMITLLTLHRQSVQRAAIEREHELASTLAQAALPKTVPVLPGVDLFARCQPANLAGGDILVLDVVDGALWFAVGDVAGKGLPAAIVMSRAVSAARVAFRAASIDGPSAALAALDADLYDYLGSVHLFVTMAVGVYRPESRELWLANAGHSPVLLVSAAGTSRFADFVPPTCPPIGVVPGTGSTRRIQLHAGDCLIIGSDGLVEQENPAGTVLGYDDFRAAVLEHAALPAAELGTYLLDRVTGHAGGAAQSDDRTLLIIRPR